MSGTTKARTARKPHLCEGCHWAPSLRGVPTILPGHRYLLHTAFPNDVVQHVYATRECVACAAERGDDYLTGACMGYCCGDIPCARPTRHDGDHSCRRCPTPSAVGGKAETDGEAR